MRRAAVIGATLALGCSVVVDSTPTNGDAAVPSSSSGGARGWRDSGAAVVTGGRPLTPEEIVCSRGLQPLVPVDADSGACEFALPAGLEGLPIARIRLQLVANGVASQEAFLNQPGDCKLNLDRGWYFDRNKTPPTIHFCTVTCAAVSSGDYQAEAGCARFMGDPTM